MEDFLLGCQGGWCLGPLKGVPHTGPAVTELSPSLDSTQQPFRPETAWMPSRISHTTRNTECDP